MMLGTKKGTMLREYLAGAGLVLLALLSHNMI